MTKLPINTITSQVFHTVRVRAGRTAITIAAVLGISAAAVCPAFAATGDPHPINPAIYTYAGDCLYVESGVTADQKQALLNGLAIVPDAVIASMQADGVTAYAFPTSSGPVSEGHETASGIYTWWYNSSTKQWRDTPKVFVHSDANASGLGAGAVIVHEYGHVVSDFGGEQAPSYCAYALTDDFKAIAAAEKATFATHDGSAAKMAAKTNTREYFAEAFRVCLADPAFMQTYCPQTYAYIASVTNNYVAAHGYGPVMGASAPTQAANPAPAASAAPAAKAAAPEAAAPNASAPAKNDPFLGIHF